VGEEVRQRDGHVFFFFFFFFFVFRKNSNSQVIMENGVDMMCVDTCMEKKTNAEMMIKK